MAIDQSTVLKIAHLARLALDENEVPRYTENLHDIFALIETMQSVNTDGVLPMSHPFEAKQRLRPDLITEPNQREALLAIAPASADGYFLVPKVIDN